MQTSKMKIGAIKESTPEAHPHVIPEVEKEPTLATEWIVTENKSITPDK